MKKVFITLALMAFFTMPSFAQYWTTTSTYDPFKNGDKHIGLTVGTGWWFGPSEALNNSQTWDNLYGYTITDVNRPPMNPTISFHYKRVLQGNNVDWGNSFYLSYNRWGGKVEGQNVDTTFTAEYQYAEAMISELFYIMIPIGDNLKINAGAGLSIGMGLKSKTTITFSNDKPVMESSNGEFSDLIIGKIIATAGLDYALSDSFTVSANVLAWPLDIFGALKEGVKDMRNLGNDLYVSNKLPFQLTVGFTYAL